jgi:uncharacterized protein (DUF1330 family)
MNMKRTLLGTMLVAAATSAFVTPAVYAQSPATAAKPPAYYISEFEVTDPEGIRPYSAAVDATFAPFGGRYAVRAAKTISLEGEPNKRVIVIAFPSLEQAQAWYNSPRYREIMPIRHKSAKSRVYIMEGTPPN